MLSEEHLSDGAEILGAVLDEGLQMTMPVGPESKTTEEECKQKVAKQAEEARSVDLTFSRPG